MKVTFSVFAQPHFFANNVLSVYLLSPLRSTIGTRELNFCVRNGNRCTLSVKTLRTLSTKSGAGFAEWEQVYLTDTVHLVNIFRLLKILVKVLQNVSHTFLTPLR